MSFAEHFSCWMKRRGWWRNLQMERRRRYENAYGKGSAILLGTFAGQENEAKTDGECIRLGGILAKWAGLTEPS